MRTRRAGLVLGLLGVLSGTAQADPPVWVATHPIQTGAQERVEHGTDGSVWAVVDHNRVLRSTDAGTTWLPVNPVPVSGLPLSGPALGGSSDTSVAPQSASVALGVNNDTFSMTRDGGTTWSPVTVPPVSKDGFAHNALLRRTGGRWWAGMSGSTFRGDCPRPLATTPLLSSADGKTWLRADLPVSSGLTWDLKFADAQHGAVSVYEYAWEYESCGYSGSSSTTVVFVTSNGGRSWRRATSCTDTCVVGWAGGTARRLVLVHGGGRVQESRNDGRTFYGTASLPSSSLAFAVTSMDCVADRCWVMHNGGGILRRDGSGEWDTEVSGASVVGICVPTLTALDHERAVSAGPHALMTRRNGGGASVTPPVSAPSTVRLPGGAVLGADGVVRQRVVVPV